MPVQLYQGNLPVPGFIGEKVRSSRRHLRRHCPEAPVEVPEDPDHGRWGQRIRAAPPQTVQSNNRRPLPLLLQTNAAHFPWQ